MRAQVSAKFWKKPSEKVKIQKLIVGTALPDPSLKQAGESNGKKLEWKSERIRSEAEGRECWGTKQEPIPFLPNHRLLFSIQRSPVNIFSCLPSDKIIRH